MTDTLTFLEDSNGNFISDRAYYLIERRGDRYVAYYPGGDARFRRPEDAQRFLQAKYRENPR